MKIKKKYARIKMGGIFFYKYLCMNEIKKNVLDLKIIFLFIYKFFFFSLFLINNNEYISKYSGLNIFILVYISY